MGWFLVLGLKEYLVECATLCVKSVVTLVLQQLDIYLQKQRRNSIPEKNKALNLQKLLLQFYFVEMFHCYKLQTKEYISEKIPFQRKTRPRICKSCYSNFISQKCFTLISCRKNYATFILILQALYPGVFITPLSM